MNKQFIYRCQRGKHTYEATIYRYEGHWNLVIELILDRDHFILDRFVEFEQFRYWSALSAKLAMYTYFPYGTVKWNRIQ